MRNQFILIDDFILGNLVDRRKSLYIYYIHTCVREKREEKAKFFFLSK